MARDSNGNYALPAGNPVVSGSTIASSWANGTMPDVATALTDSLDRNGRGGMLAPFKFADGSESAPGAGWTSEPSTGLYRAGAGDLRISVQNQDLVRFQGGMLQVWGADSAWHNVLFEDSSGALLDGTASWQTIVWNNSSGAWELTSNIIMNDATSEITASEFHGVADDALSLNGYKFEVVATMPGTPDASTLYFVTG